MRDTLKHWLPNSVLYNCGVANAANITLSATAVRVVFRIASLLLLQGAACRHRPVERVEGGRQQARKLIPRSISLGVGNTDIGQ